MGRRTRARGRAAPATPLEPPPPTPEPATPSTSTSTSTSADPPRPSSASSKKLRRSLNPEVDEARKDWQGFRVIDLDLLVKSILSNTVCKVCFNSVKISETHQVGLSSVFTLSCSTCGLQDNFRNSQMLSKNIAEVNRRSVYAFKSLGLGYSDYKEFFGVMDFPTPVANTTFDRALDAIQEASNAVAKESMTRAAKEEKEATGKETITVSGDGTWQKRGFTSLFGIVTLVGLITGKVLDFFVLSLVCKICDAYRGPQEGVEYEVWQEEHSDQCTKNHEGSSGSMEVSGMLELFKRSVAQRGVIYEEYIGDGDSKTYKAVCEKNPYPNVQIRKKECTAHVQKRMGTRLRNRKKELSGKKLSDGKPISGKGRLTDKVIDKIAEYYGKAIRSSTTIEEMKKKVWATYHHMSATDKKPSYQFCPKGSDSWCTYQKAVANKTVRQYKHKQNIPLVCLEACKKVFEDLTHDDLLQRCIGGFTQNPNESFNNVIWQRCPKVRFFGKKSVDIAAAEAAIQFNDGCRGKIRVLREMGVQPGRFCINWAIAADDARVVQAEQRAQESTKEARVARLKKRKEAERAAEDDSYVPGGH